MTATPEQDRNDCHFSRCIDHEHCRLGGRCEAAWAMGAPIPPANDPRVEAAESVLHDDECDVADGCRCNRAEQDRRVHLARQTVQAVDTVVMHAETNRRALAPEQDRPDRLDEIKWRAETISPLLGAFTAPLAGDIQWLIGEVERLQREVAARAGAWQRLNQSYDDLNHTAVLWQDQAERAGGWLSELADVLDMEGAEPSALMWRVRESAGVTDPSSALPASPDRGGA